MTNAELIDMLKGLEKMAFEKMCRADDMRYFFMQDEEKAAQYYGEWIAYSEMWQEAEHRLLEVIRERNEAV